MTDFRHALRALRAAPGFTIVAILVLALGIGATSAMFGVVDGVLLRPLPYAAPERLVAVTASHPRQGDFFPLSVADFEDFRRTARGFDGMALARGEALLLRGSEGATAITTAHVTDGFFGVLGVRALLGRTFVAEEQGPAARKALVLSHALWMREFGGDPAVVGRALDFAEGSYRVVGVLPPSLPWPQWAEAYAPLATVAQRREALTNRTARVDNATVARLAPGVTPEAGDRALAAVARALAEQAPENAEWTARVQPLQEAVVGQSGRPLWVLLGAVGAVLLIACANVANLQLVRAATRRQELAVRAALGAPRWRIVRQLLAESAVLSLAGAAAGLLLAAWLVALVRQVAAQSLPRVPEVAIDARVAAFAVAVAALTALLAGIIPAVAASRTAVAPVLREGGRGTVGGRRPVRAVLVAGEIALALMLLVGAGVLMRSFARLREAGVGFDAARVLAVRFEPPSTRYDSPEKLAALFERLGARIAAVPGVQRAGFVNHVPLGRGTIPTQLEGPGLVGDGQAGSTAIYRTPDATYLEALGVRVLRGRGFTPDDMRPGSAAVLVNETLARQRWGTLDVVGRSVTYRKQAQGRPDFNTPVAATVVGVVNDVAFGVLGQPSAPELYVPSASNPWRWGYFAVRTAGDPMRVATAVRRAIAAEDRDISIAEVRPIADMAAGGIADRRFAAGLLGAFAGAALVLAALGVYGVMAYSVAQRTHEIGVRTALGATPRQVWRLVVGSGARIAAAGVAAGLLLSLAATRTLEGLVFGIGVRDGVSFAAGSIVLALVTLVASWVPARRAARLDPARVLRSE